jgi:uncharacterized membrane protein YphA (DoxX/SURF4 family)
MTAFELTALVARFVVGAVFTVAGLLKVADMQETAAVSARYEAVPPSLERLAVLGTYPLTGIELLAGIGMLIGFVPLLSAATIMALLLAFTPLLIYEIAVGNEMDDCGCYGILELPLTPHRVVENVVLMALLTVHLLWLLGT